MKKNIKVGDRAPAIDASDLWGNKISTAANEKWMYLSFHRFSACPFCNLRTNELVRNYDLFKKYNTEVISIWPSDKDRLLRYAGSEKLPFPLLSDKDKRIYMAYGVTESTFIGAIRLLLHPQLLFHAIRDMHKNIEVDADPKLMPASFLIDPYGIVRLAYYGKHYADHPEIESILQIIR